MALFNTEINIAFPRILINPRWKILMSSIYNQTTHILFPQPEARASRHSKYYFETVLQLPAVQKYWKEG